VQARLKEAGAALGKFPKEGTEAEKLDWQERKQEVTALRNEAKELAPEYNALKPKLAALREKQRLSGMSPEEVLAEYSGVKLPEGATGLDIPAPEATSTPQTWELTLDAFPDALELTRTPVQGITSIIYADSTGTNQTLSGSAYTLDAADGYGHAYVVPAYRTSWPDTRDQVNAVAVRYLAGYASAAAAPESIKSWIKLAVGSMYTNRESTVVDRGSVLSLGFADSLLDRYKVWAL
jgi:uncharacterized phiE125 gp8 family phage protein